MGRKAAEGETPEQTLARLQRLKSVLPATPTQPPQSPGQPWRPEPPLAQPRVYPDGLPTVDLGGVLARLDEQWPLDMLVLAWPSLFGADHPELKGSAVTLVGLADNGLLTLHRGNGWWAPLRAHPARGLPEVPKPDPYTRAWTRSWMLWRVAKQPGVTVSAFAGSSWVGAAAQSRGFMEQQQAGALRGRTWVVTPQVLQETDQAAQAAATTWRAFTQEHQSLYKRLIRALTYTGGGGG